MHLELTGLPMVTKPSKMLKTSAKKVRTRLGKASTVSLATAANGPE
jgi:hypothetical protein